MAEPSASPTLETTIAPPLRTFQATPTSVAHPPPSAGRSSRKRPQSSINDDASIGTLTSVAFSETVKRNVAQLLGNFCWHCGATPIQVCHVIPKKHGSFLELKRNGLITFEHLGSEQNAIALCGTCHTNFDNPNQPAFTFLPKDLRYFVDFEKRDFNYREERLRRSGGILDKRAVPTAAAYLQQQITAGEVELDAIGGLYQSYTWRNYFPTFVTQENYSFIPGPGPFSPGEWHGDPMAAIWRGFRILGDLLNKIPEEEENLLWELRRLYQREPKLQDDSAEITEGTAEDEDNDGWQGQGRNILGLDAGGSGGLAQPSLRPRDMPPPSGRPLRTRPPRRNSADEPVANDGTAGGGSSTDSAIDVTPGTLTTHRKRRSVSLTNMDTNDSNPPSKRRVIGSAHMSRKCPTNESRTPSLQQTDLNDMVHNVAQRISTSQHLRPRPTREAQWLWGPGSSSSQKARKHSAGLGIYDSYLD